MNKKKPILILIITLLLLSLTSCQDNNDNKKETQPNEPRAYPTHSANADIKNYEVDVNSSASIVPNKLIQHYKPKGFTNSDKKKALFIIADPRNYSVTYDLGNTAMKYFEDNNIEVELRDLHAMNFDQTINKDDILYYIDAIGEPSDYIKKEQNFISKADYLIFVNPNYHDTPPAITKAYIQKVFGPGFAFEENEAGLKGLLTNKSMYTIINSGYLGGGRGYIGDGIGNNNDLWNIYMNAFEFHDSDLAAFWGLENKGRFVNDITPKNNSKTYENEINELREALRINLNKVFLN